MTSSSLTSESRPVAGVKSSATFQPQLAAMSEAESSLTKTADALQETPEESASSSEPKSQFWRVFFSTFVTIFLAELGDKTQVTTLLMSAESHSPWVVFLGSSTALIATSLIGVLLGQWLAQRLSPRTLDKAAGLLLLGITTWMIWDITHL